MNGKIMPVTQVLEDSFVYSCTFEQQYSSYEQFYRTTFWRFSFRVKHIFNIKTAS